MGELLPGKNVEIAKLPKKLTLESDSTRHGVQKTVLVLLCGTLLICDFAGLAVARAVHASWEKGAARL